MGWLVGAAAVGLGASLPTGLAWVFTHPPRRLHKANPSRFGIPFQRVRLRTADDLTLSAWFVPAPGDAEGSGARPRAVLVMCHGYYGNRACLLPHLRFLHRAGYAALLFDFRAHGWSGGRLATFGCKETLDLAAALDWVVERPELRDLPLAVVGESMGASVALMTAAEDERVRAVVADSAFARFDSAVQGRLRLAFGRLGDVMRGPTQRVGERILGVRCEEIAPVDAIGRIAPRPVLLIHGTHDYLIPSENAHRLRDAAPGNAALWEVPGAYHTGAIVVAPDEYERRVLDFLETALAV
uniref:AB hydrolase-1 domain-containing protein n=1 Tax=uncultured Armatimonadetes bacterium TaxID=157466 RepID=A0A6J4H3R0_9BACT|nr:hypothetical protein AVDCRST_MAG63-111 [uncultured Armatimonadetes bacterium]